MNPARQAVFLDFMFLYGSRRLQRIAKSRGDLGDIAKTNLYVRTTHAFALVAGFCAGFRSITLRL